MAQRIDRILFLLFILAGSLRLFAQTPSSELGVTVIRARLEESGLSDENIDRSGQFDEKTGYGISFNRYWTDHLSTELAAHQFSADAVIGAHSVEGEEFFTEGEVELRAITAIAQWHFHRGSVLAPYLGAGIARMSGKFNPDVNPDVASYRFKTRVMLALNAGANVRITERLFLTGDVKYIPWNMIGEEDAEGLDVDPLLVGAGVKVRF
jgi:outer membrane protein W